MWNSRMLHIWYSRIISYRINHIVSYTHCHTAGMSHTVCLPCCLYCHTAGMSHTVWLPRCLYCHTAGMSHTVWLPRCLYCHTAGMSHTVWLPSLRSNASCGQDRPHPRKGGDGRLDHIQLSITNWRRLRRNRLPRAFFYRWWRREGWSWGRGRGWGCCPGGWEDAQARPELSCTGVQPPAKSHRNFEISVLIGTISSRLQRFLSLHSHAASAHSKLPDSAYPSTACSIIVLIKFGATG